MQQQSDTLHVPSFHNDNTFLKTFRSKFQFPLLKPTGRWRRRAGFSGQPPPPPSPASLHLSALFCALGLMRAPSLGAHPWWICVSITRDFPENATPLHRFCDFYKTASVPPARVCLRRGCASPFRVWLMGTPVPFRGRTLGSAAASPAASDSPSHVAAHVQINWFVCA